jgi:hypothetical protein
MIGEPLHNFGVLVGGIIVEHGMDRLAGGNGAFDGVEELDEVLVGVLGMQRPMTVPCRTSRAANRVVVPLRL